MCTRLVTAHQNSVIFPSLHTISSLGNPPRILNQRLRLCRSSVKGVPQIKCTADSANGVGGSNQWEKWIPRHLFAAEKVFGAIAGATSSPIAQYISSPTTFLHRVDPRIKMVVFNLARFNFYWNTCTKFASSDRVLVWLFAVVISPAKSDMAVRLGVVIYLALLSIWVQPSEMWKDQLGRVTLLCGVLFVLTGLSTDSAPSFLCSRSPPPSVTGISTLPASFEGYKYVIMKFGPLQLTRKGLSAATTAACLTFTIFQSATLCLTTTTSEQLAFALQWFILPLRHVGVPVAEVILTLLLSLRFISLVFDEVRNVALAIVCRRIQWHQLTTLETMDVFFTYLRRILSNIYNHADQITQAMIVRGFRGDCQSHQVLLSAGSSTRIANVISVSCLIALIFATNFSH